MEAAIADEGLRPDSVAADLRDVIDCRLRQLLPAPRTAEDAVANAIHDGVLNPGKRLRPLLMLLAAQELGGQPETVLDLACAVEMVHCASLFLDDMPCMDDAKLRRGRPALHLQYGEDVAVLAAVAVLAQAFGVVASAQPLDGVARAEATVLLSGAVGLQGLVRGQYDDLRGGRGPREADEIAATNHCKTGCLFAAAVAMVAVALGVEHHRRQLLQDFARELGHAFQLLDDLQDGDASAATLGKDVGQDLGKSTLVAALGRETARRRQREHVAAARALAQALPNSRGLLVGLLETLFEPRRRPSSGAQLRVGPRALPRTACS
jgi:geranylgeranyl diphosphate synthase type II